MLWSQQVNSAEPNQLIKSTQRLTIEQIRELAQAGQWKEAVSLLDSFRTDWSLLIECHGEQAAGTQRIQLYQPLAVWSQMMLRMAFEQDEALAESNRQQWDKLASAAMQSLQQQHQGSAARQAVHRFIGTTLDDKLAMLWVDCYLEYGQVLAAMQALETSFPELTQVDLTQLSATTTADTPAIDVPWHRVWAAVSDDAKLAPKALHVWQEAASVNPILTQQVLQRLDSIAVMSQDCVDGSILAAWISTAGKNLPELEASPEAEEAAVSAIAKFPTSEVPQSNLPRDEKPIGSLQQPAWQQPLDRWVNGSDLTPASRPPIGQLQAAQPYHPAIREGIIFLNELTRIAAYNLETGQTWPDNSSKRPLFDSHQSTVEYLPLGYPVQGLPRAGLSIDDNCLYARMGSPVTGWHHRGPAHDDASASYLVGLDLDRQGVLLRGFPLRLVPPTFRNSEFEGTPIVAGQKLIVTICQRDQVNLRRSLAAFDRYSGQLIWHSQPLASGSVIGSEQSNLISATQPILAGGLLYFGTNLGTVACVEPDTGQLLWLARYKRQHRLDTVGRAERFRYRDGCNCIIHRGLLYCLPQDSPELFALDAITGDLVWATDDQEVTDCNQIVGVVGDSLIANGDRLVWLSRTGGDVLGQYPTNSTPGFGNALSQPRGLGHAQIAGSCIYWPTQDEIILFPGELSPAKSGRSVSSGFNKLTAPILHRLSTQSGGYEGGNLKLLDGGLLLSTPGRLIFYRTVHK